MRTITNCPPKVKAAMNRVMVSYAAWKAAEEIDKESKKRVLAENDFRYCYPEGTPGAEKQGEKITKVNADFLMSDSDFEKYCQLVYAENLKAGLDSGGVGLTFWPLRKAVIDAENTFIDTIAEDIPQFTPEVVKTIKQDMKSREKFLKITFGESYKA